MHLVKTYSYSFSLYQKSVAQFGNAVSKLAKKEVIWWNKTSLRCAEMQGVFCSDINLLVKAVPKKLYLFGEALSKTVPNYKAGYMAIQSRTVGQEQ